MAPNLGGGRLDPLWEKWPEMRPVMLTDHFPFFPKWVQPTPPLVWATVGKGGGGFCIFFFIYFFFFLFF